MDPLYLHNKEKRSKLEAELARAGEKYPIIGRNFYSSFIVSALNFAEPFFRIKMNCSGRAIPERGMIGIFAEFPSKRKHIIFEYLARNGMESYGAPLNKLDCYELLCRIITEESVKSKIVLAKEGLNEKMELAKKILKEMDEKGYLEGKPVLEKEDIPLALKLVKKALKKDLDDSHSN